MIAIGAASPFPLAGAHVLITGATRGIGLALAREATQRGARLSVLARPSDRLSAVARELGACSIPTDLRDLDAVAGVISAAEANLGPLDVVINNAAMMGTGALATLSAAGLRDTLTANLLAPAELARASAASMITRHRGVIVAVSSFAGEMALRNIGAYSTSKGALTHLTRVLQRELRGTGVRALPVLLGGVDTELIRENDADPVAGPAARRLSAIPADAPDVIAAKILAAVESGRRRPLAVPAAGLPLIGLRGLPSNLADAILFGLPRSYR
ncbi:SDR family NAD(P)-dependent oxidoreductase [Mycobacterium sp.]|uniref:SDR family NAD(P)-dependent oxidoreductase n=1 Tax=Mycobacterium sp. TaxID=1785 RepID=UPI0025EACE5C|nr:SDR family NAD(P)-dependent oxidoreductase [Mycobacterium sp.]